MTVVVLQIYAQQQQKVAEPAQQVQVGEYDEIFVPVALRGLKVAPATPIDIFGCRSDGALVVPKKDVKKEVKPEEENKSDEKIIRRVRIESGLKTLPIYGVVEGQNCIIGKYILKIGETISLKADDIYKVKITKIGSDRVTFEVPDYGQFNIEWKKRATFMKAADKEKQFQLNQAFAEQRLFVAPPPPEIKQKNPTQSPLSK